jgi:NAD(P)-dependent dehydrogenase (short-subunit alcohol dehydrogenase family)
VIQKTVYISGGTSGINLGIARAFAMRGDNVLIFGRDSAKAAAAGDSLKSVARGAVMAGVADVRDYGAIGSLFAQACAKIGSPDAVVAGAAGNFVAPAVDISANGFKAVVDIDVMGTYNVFRQSYDLLRKPGASLIAITAPQANQPMARQVHVCAAKAGVNMIVKVLALEWGPAGIRVNAISPGPIAGTEGVERMAPSPIDKEEWANQIALRRFGTPEDIAQTALFLCSEQASFITGSIINCDGGMELGSASGDHISPGHR